MNSAEISLFVRGPLFSAALLFFIFGMMYRLVRAISLGWGRSHVPAKGNTFLGAVAAFLRGLIIFPFAPRTRDTGMRNPLTYVAGGIFHVGFMIVVFLGGAHILAWESLLGFRWPGLPLPIIDFFAAASLIALFILAYNRYANPVLRLLTRTSDWVNLLVVIVPFLTGFFLTHRLFLAYEQMFTLHMMSIIVLLIWIPLSRISHFMFYFITKPRHGVRFAQRGAKP
jgi:nitrate reductase gamma subunit